MFLQPSKYRLKLFLAEVGCLNIEVNQSANLVNRFNEINKLLTVELSHF